MNKMKEIDSEQHHSCNNIISDKDLDSDYNEGIDIDILDSSLKHTTVDKGPKIPMQHETSNTDNNVLSHDNQQLF